MENMDVDDVFVDRTRTELIQRVSLVMPLADELLSKRMLSKEAYANIKAEKTPQDKMRALYEALDTEGSAAKTAFYQALMRQNPHLVQELEKTLSPAGMLR
ncbi:NACHT, LRR and PYD domains-containing protein 1b allele 3-like isoform X2 [Colossoma macropomum]|uniref:NACHT, LRR and PYD domains-containing protein 1b allele 3-like isoform X2 n=1 Tax=Colossoma macropomum TaxID=42526 RepID=UPI001864CA3A|nr:NACHT, LRR and PYD domains-containing protein 1b allele 3-like isoform X2 [Colossoma macropomum]